jgi:hypothetical protein
MIRDALPWMPARPRVGSPLGEGALDLQPSGTIARAGDGWLEDPDRVLLASRRGGLFRLIVSTGELHRPALPEGAGQGHAIPVTPLWTGS